MTARIVQRVLGISMSAVASLFVLVTLVALLDPIGSQQANDADPFGTPPSLAWLWVELALSSAVLAGGIWLSLRAARSAPRAAATELSQTQATDRRTIPKEFR